MEEIKTIKQIFRIHGLEQPTTVQRINTGFNRAVFDIDNKYVLCDHSKVHIPKHYIKYI